MTKRKKNSAQKTEINNAPVMIFFGQLLAPENKYRALVISKL